MGPNLVDTTPHQTDLEPAPKDESQTLKPVTHSAQSGDIYLTATPSPIHLNQLDPDLLPVPPALILHALALTPVDRSGSRTPAIVKRTSWIQNENCLPLDGFVSLDPRFNYFPSHHSKFPKPIWPKTSPTIPTSFFKDHRRKKKVGGSGSGSLQGI